MIVNQFRASDKGSIADTTFLKQLVEESENTKTSTAKRQITSEYK